MGSAYRKVQAKDPVSSTRKTHTVVGKVSMISVAIGVCLTGFTEEGDILVLIIANRTLTSEKSFFLHSLSYVCDVVHLAGKFY